jgi:hypothetical protein
VKSKEEGGTRANVEKLVERRRSMSSFFIVS